MSFACLFSFGDFTNAKVLRLRALNSFLIPGELSSHGLRFFRAGLKLTDLNLPHPFHRRDVFRRRREFRWGRLEPKRVRGRHRAHGGPQRRPARPRGNNEYNAFESFGL